MMLHIYEHDPKQYLGLPDMLCTPCNNNYQCSMIITLVKESDTNGMVLLHNFIEGQS